MNPLSNNSDLSSFLDWLKTYDLEDEGKFNLLDQYSRGVANRGKWSHFPKEIAMFMGISLDYYSSSTVKEGVQRQEYLLKGKWK